MNERIKQLMDLAELPLFDINGNCKYNDTYFDKEKFAELIVRECIEQVFYTIEDQEQDNISSSIRDRIKQHFGVEE